MIAQKFKWVSETRFKVINNYGYEKLIDISDGLKQIGYGRVPMIDLKKLEKENNTHFYFDQKIDDIN